MKKISTANKFKGNPRLITQSQFDLLKEHLEELGDLSGVIYCNNNKAFVGGNQRSEVFNGAEIELIEVFEKPTKSHTVANGFIHYKGEKFAYREVFFTEEQFKKACIVANNDGGTWNWDELANNWDQEKLIDWGMNIPEVPEVEEQPKERKPKKGIFIELEDDQMFDLHTAIDKMKQTKEYEYCEVQSDDASVAIYLICREYNQLTK